MAGEDFGAENCYDTLGNKLYFGLRLDQLMGIVSGYFLLFALLAMHYHKSRTARRSMAAKVDSMTVTLENMESQLARLESIHIVLEAMPQLLEQRLHGTNTRSPIVSPKSLDSLESESVPGLHKQHSKTTHPSPTTPHQEIEIDPRFWSTATYCLLPNNRTRR
ncbi:MAG: hypothetical protein BYD32DRAFT_421563 [Podila humilis]|nr:MAG: hypothetical protein BYD32DRAFT_421563 [Podila humilis]